MLGVMTDASGKSRSVSAPAASSLMRRAPDVATITGSTTTLWAFQVCKRSAMASMMAAEDTMPIFTAAGGMSWKTASICAATKLGLASSTALTPQVF